MGGSPLDMPEAITSGQKGNFCPKLTRSDVVAISRDRDEQQLLCKVWRRNLGCYNHEYLCTYVESLLEGPSYVMCSISFSFI